MIFLGVDISSTISWVVNMFIQGFTTMFNILSSFEFAGTNLLSVIVTITILTAFLPVLLTIPNTKSAYKKGKESVKDDNRTK